VPLLVYSWHLLSGGESAQQRRILDETGQVRRIVDVPQPNREGTKLVFGQDTEDGFNVCLLENTSSQSRVLYHQPKPESFKIGFKNLGWSPEDEYFAYHRLQRQDRPHQIVICDGNSGATLAEVDIGPIIGGVWTSSQALVCVGSDGILYQIAQDRGGSWTKAERFKCDVAGNLIPDDKLRLAAYKGGIVWAKGGSLWSCNAASNAPTEILALASGDIINFAYSPATGKFLLYRGNYKNGEQIGDALTCFNTRTGSLTDWDRIDSDSNETTRNSPFFYTAVKVAWINDGSGYVNKLSDPYPARGETLVIKKSIASEPIRLRWPNQAIAYAASDNHLYVVGCRSNEPTAIWDYDLASGSLDSAVPNLPRPCRYSTIVTPAHTEVHTVNRGEPAVHSWDLYAPVHPSPGKKYPAIIAAFMNSGYAQAAANCGIYYVDYDQFTYEDKYGDEASEEHFSFFLNTLLAGNPNIDPNRLFLMAASGQCHQSVYPHIKAHPGKFRGAILLSPGVYPSPASFAGTKILIDGGRDEPYYQGKGLARLMEFRDAALLAGVPVITALHAGEGHGERLMAVASVKEQETQILKFVSEP
jgi:hypothetical protein